MSEFRVSARPDGEARWWTEGYEIPVDHSNIRQATDAEAALMRRILKHRTPPVELGEQVETLMRATNHAIAKL